MAYTEKYFDRWIEKYVKAHPHEKITMVELAAFSGISARTWYRHRKAIEKINKINNTPVTVSLTDGAELPTATQLVDSCKGRDDLVKMTQSLLDEIIRLRMEAGKAERGAVTSLKEELKEKDATIDQLKAQINSNIVAALPDMSAGDVIRSTGRPFLDQFSSLFGGNKNE